MAASSKSRMFVPDGICAGGTTACICSPSTKIAAGRIPCGETTRRETKACKRMVSIAGPQRDVHQKPSLSRPLHFFNPPSSRIRAEKGFARFQPPLILLSLAGKEQRAITRVKRHPTYEQLFYGTRDCTRSRKCPLGTRRALRRGDRERW